jgi:flagellar hook-associated protein FlgK
LDQLFSSARDLSSDPASTVLRASFVRDAQGLTSRFGELSSQMDMIQDETDQAIQSNVNNMNTIFGNLATVNKQLTKVQTEAAQPPDLLDQRDKLLKDLSAYARVNASFSVNGTATVSLGASINQDVVVFGNTSKLISASSDPLFPGKTNLILDQYGKASTLTGISSGSLSGLLTFQDQVLGTSRSALDNLASVLTKEINAVHAQGKPLVVCRHQRGAALAAHQLEEFGQHLVGRSHRRRPPRSVAAGIRPAAAAARKWALADTAAAGTAAAGTAAADTAVHTFAEP